jgi:hypothetical protein
MRPIALLTFLIAASSLWAQVPQWRLLPSVNVNKKFVRDWSANLRIESRQVLFEAPERFNYELTDIALAGAKKLSLRTSLAVGALVRLEEDASAFRSFQQFTVVRRYGSLRASHRFAADQTFSAVESPEFRVRYRFSGERALSGESVDPREFFTKFNNEYLGGMQGGEFDPELRLAAFLGYAITPSKKLELGLENRLDGFLSDAPRQRWWIGVNVFVSL